VEAVELPKSKPKRKRKKKRMRRLILAVEWTCLEVAKVVETTRLSLHIVGNSYNAHSKKSLRFCIL